MPPWHLTDDLDLGTKEKVLLQWIRIGEEPLSKLLYKLWLDPVYKYLRRKINMLKVNLPFKGYGQLWPMFFANKRTDKRRNTWGKTVRRCEEYRPRSDSLRYIAGLWLIDWSIDRSIAWLIDWLILSKMYIWTFQGNKHRVQKNKDEYQTRGALK